MFRNVRPDRGIYEAIRAFKHLQELSDEYNDWALHIYGFYSESSNYYKACIREVHESQLNVRFFGHIHPSDVNSKMIASALTLVPSIDMEGTSLAALESMSLGTPCVSTPVGGLNSLPTFKSRDISAEAIAQAVDTLVRNYDNNCRKQAEWSVQNGLGNWINKFNTVIESTRAVRYSTLTK